MQKLCFNLLLPTRKNSASKFELGPFLHLNFVHPYQLYFFFEYGLKYVDQKWWGIFK
jgi:hypothetical protein